MTVTVLPPSAHTAGSVLSALTTPVVRAEGTRTVVVLLGEADFSTRPVLADALSRVIALHTGDVVIDLAEAEFIDTDTVRVLAVAQQLLDRHDRKLTFRSPSRLAARMLYLFGLTDLIEAPIGDQPWWRVSS
jgi:anti-anti-sigma factor